MQRPGASAPFMRLLALVWVASADSAFAPGTCVDLKKSTDGTCEFRTACKHYAKFDDLEFNFICQADNGEKVEHVFENDGGIPRAGVYDTTQVCAKCLPPAKHSLVAQKEDGDDVDSDAGADAADDVATDAPADDVATDAPADDAGEGEGSDAATDAPASDDAADDAGDDAADSDAVSDAGSGSGSGSGSDSEDEAEGSGSGEGSDEEATTTAAPTTTEAATGPPETAAFYGPNGCVAAYRNSAGSCIMQTNKCPIADMKAFNFGFTCVDGSGDSERHLMGVGSFHESETFDTLVKCHLCLGLDNEAVNAPKTKAISEDVSDLKNGMADLTSAVKSIKDHMLAEGIIEASQEEESASSDEATSFLHKKPHTHTGKIVPKSARKGHATVNLAAFDKPHSHAGKIHSGHSRH